MHSYKLDAGLEIPGLCEDLEYYSDLYEAASLNPVFWQETRHFSLNYRGFVYHKSRDLEKAEEFYAADIGYLKQMYKTSCWPRHLRMIGEVCIIMTNICKLLGDHVKEEQYLLECLSLSEQLADTTVELDDRGNIIKIYTVAADFYRKNNNFRLADSYIQSAVLRAEELIKEVDAPAIQHMLAVAYKEKASIMHHRLNHYYNSLPEYEKFRFDMPALKNEIVQCCKKAIPLLEKLIEETGNSTGYLELANLYNDIGVMLDKDGEPWFDRAVNLIEELYRRTKLEDILIALLKIYSQAINSLSVYGSADKVVEYIRRAQRTIDSLSAEQCRKAFGAIAALYLCAGNACCNIKKYDMAVPYLRKYLETNNISLNDDSVKARFKTPNADMALKDFYSALYMTGRRDEAAQYAERFPEIITGAAIAAIAEKSKAHREDNAPAVKKKKSFVERMLESGDFELAEDYDEPNDNSDTGYDELPDDVFPLFESSVPSFKDRLMNRVSDSKEKVLGLFFEYEEDDEEEDFSTVDTFDKFEKFIKSRSAEGCD